MNRRRSKLSRSKPHRLIEHFVAGTPARTAAELVGVNRNTATLYYRKLRETIAEHVAGESPFAGEVEMDESYFESYFESCFGGRRKGKRGRGAAGKVAVFGILKRGGRVYTVVPPDLKRSTLMPIIRGQVRPDAVVYTDGFSAYDTLDVAGFEHQWQALNTTGLITEKRWSAKAAHISTGSRTSGARPGGTFGGTMASPG